MWVSGELATDEKSERESVPGVPRNQTFFLAHLTSAVTNRPSMVSGYTRHGPSQIFSSAANSSGTHVADSPDPSQFLGILRRFG